MMSPSPECYMTLWGMIICSDTLHWPKITPTCVPIWNLLPNLIFYPIARGSHWTFATGVACQQRTLTPSVGSTLVLARVQILRLISPKYVLLPDIVFRISLGTSILHPIWRSCNILCLTDPVYHAVPFERFERTRQIFWYRATATRQGPQKSNTTPHEEAAKPTGASYNLDKVWRGAPDVRFVISQQGCL